MMSWKMPSLENPLEYQTPRWSLWLFCMIIAGGIGFSIGIYLLSSELLPDTADNTVTMILFTGSPVLLIFLVCYFIETVTYYKCKYSSEILEQTKRKWRSWAGKHVGVLTHFRLTQLDESQQSRLKLTPHLPNKDNRLALNSLKSLSVWEKQEKVVQQLLEPIAAYYHQYRLNQDITLYWQAENDNEDWQEYIQQAASRLLLPIKSIEKLPYDSFSEWFLTLYDNTFNSELYAVLAFQLAPSASEEAGSLLLAPQCIYHPLGTPVKAKLLRPISTDRDTFSEALAAQCDFQSSGEQLVGVWHCGVRDNEKGKFVENYARQGITQLSEHFYDIDALLGQGGIARHVVALSLVCESPHHQLIVYGDKNRYLLQQLQNIA
ncbi:hypothetical protein [Providencia rettgeri]|uniref:hypothetical protein n=1 Tax=Providencia rettgeri TaxID=587 RepID=UPI0034E0B971